MKKNKNISVYKQNILIVSEFITLVYLTYTIFTYIYHNTNIFVSERYRNYFEGLLGLLYGASVIATTAITITDKNRRFRILFEIASIIVMTAPLLIVTPIGPRNFFTNYILLVMIAIEMFDYLTIDTKCNINYLLIPIIIILVIFYMFIYGYVFKIETIRNRYIEENKTSAQVLYLPKLPFTEYMQCANPINKDFEKKFKLFYDIEKDKKLVFMDYGEWKENVNK